MTSPAVKQNRWGERKSGSRHLYTQSPQQSSDCLSWLPRKKHDNQRRDKFLHSSPPRIVATLSRFSGGIPFWTAQKGWRNERITGDTSKNPVETAPQKCRRVLPMLQDQTAPGVFNKILPFSLCHGPFLDR